MDVRVKLEQINPLEGYGHPFLWKDRMKNETERSDKNNNIVQETSVAQDIVQLLLKIAFISSISYFYISLWNRKNK